MRTSSLTSRAEHCRGTDIILCGFHVTELALVGWGVGVRMEGGGVLTAKCNLCCSVYILSTRLSTPSSFHRCLLDMRRLPPQAPCTPATLLLSAAVIRKTKAGRPNPERHVQSLTRSRYNEEPRWLFGFFFPFAVSGLLANDRWSIYVSEWRCPPVSPESLCLIEFLHWERR